MSRIFRTRTAFALTLVIATLGYGAVVLDAKAQHLIDFGTETIVFISLVYALIVFVLTVVHFASRGEV